MVISFLRVLKFGAQDVFRNVWLTLTTVVMIFLALFSINILLVVQVLGKTAMENVKDRVDVNIYIKSGAEDSKIIDLKNKIMAIQSVKDVEYVSKTEAISLFKSKYKNNPEILEALRELGKNPLTPSLVVKPKDTNNISMLINDLSSVDSEIIDSRDFTDYKALLMKINNITNKINKVGIFVSVIFLLITILVVYNSVRISIYTHRKEIMIMRLVGASNYFVSMPFVFSGVVYSFLGMFFMLVLFYPFLSLLQPYLEIFFMDFNVNIINYFSFNFFVIFGLEFLVVAVVNIFASLVAVRKYARV